MMKTKKASEEYQKVNDIMRPLIKRREELLEELYQVVTRMREVKKLKTKAHSKLGKLYYHGNGKRSKA